MIYLLVGNSGSGKTTQAKILEKENGFHKIATFTTREMRPGEINDVDYHFVTEEKFMENVKDGKILEWTRYAGHLYGTPREDVLKYKNTKENCVLLVDLEGVKKIKEELDAIVIYLKTDKNHILKRLKERNETETVVKARMNCIQNYDKYSDYILNGEESIDKIHRKILEIVDKN